MARYIEGLDAEIRDELLAGEVPTRLDPLIDSALRVERRFELRQRARRALTTPTPSSTGSSPSTASIAPEPMQLGGIRISAVERQHRIINRLCLYCGSEGHFVATCLVKARAHQS